MALNAQIQALDEYKPKRNSAALFTVSSANLLDDDEAWDSCLDVSVPFHRSAANPHPDSPSLFFTPTGPALSWDSYFPMPKEPVLHSSPSKYQTQASLASEHYLGHRADSPTIPALDIEAELKKQSLYKTELCRNWQETRVCRYGAKCQFAHGKEELRYVARHPKYKTEVCRTFQTTGECGYGPRCRFVHTINELRSTEELEADFLFKQQLDQMKFAELSLTSQPYAVADWVDAPTSPPFSPSRS